MIGNDIFTLLGISSRSSPERVRRAFRVFAKQNHPDLFPGDALREEVFKQVNAAYQSWKCIAAALEEIRRMKRTASARRKKVGCPTIPGSKFSCRA